MVQHGLDGLEMQLNLVRQENNTEDSHENKFVKHQEEKHCLFITN